MGDDDFLSRWSRRKRAVAEEESEDLAPGAVEAEPAPLDEEEEAELLARLNLPVPESLQPGDDFSAFMAKGVPGFLRKRALRVLWRSNPVLANLDGLNDYDEDFTSPELTQKVLATAYQVGRGFVSQVSQGGEQESVVEEDADSDDDVEREIEGIVISSVNQEPEDTVVHNEEPQPATRPRRMRFDT